MPTTYTHYAYGQDVFKKLPEQIQKSIEPYMDYYNIGVHGPDILFYYHSYHKNSVNQYGIKVHHEPAREFFKRAFKVFQVQKNKRAACAYLAGFMTHFILDSTCHPYVRKRTKETGISHTEIETDWDFQVLQKAGEDLDHYKRACHVKNRKEIAMVIAPYFKKSAKQIRVSLFHMKLVINHIFRSGFGVKRAIAMIIGGYVCPELEIHHHFIPREIHPGDKETCQHLWELYYGSQDLCVEMITKLYNALHSMDTSFCKEKRLSRDFS